MKYKFLIPILVLVFIFNFGLISCRSTNIESDKIKSLENELESKNKEMGELKEELRVTKIDLESVQKELDKKIEEEKENEEQEKPKTQEYRIGDTILFSNTDTGEDFCSVTIHSIENFTDYGRRTPDEGMRYVILDVEVENRSNEVQGYNALNYSLRDADYYRYDNMGYAKEPVFSSGDLAPMDKMRGWVTIELPKDIIVTEILAGPCYCDPPAIIKVVPPLE